MRVFSGIQPTGQKHLGNYLGAVRQYVKYQEQAEGIYCIVDLHAITVSYEPKELRERLYDTTALLVAAGLDPDRCTLFRQSDVQAHAELCWLLTAVTAHGDLNRMHQFKDKSEKQRELVSAGLFLYPVLQAADVLAYAADEVPVGEDQRQHLELCRDIAERFNTRFGETLKVPKHRIPEVGAKIMDLQVPESKMSTSSSSEAGTIIILDTEKQTEKKIKSAVTDSGSEIKVAADKPGISNLIEIYAAVKGISHKEVEQTFAEARYGDFKQAVADAVNTELQPLRERYSDLRANQSELESILAAGAEKASKIAQPVVTAVKSAMGVGSCR